MLSILCHIFAKCGVSQCVCSASAKPIVVYNIPQHSNCDITPAIFKRLMEIDNVQYIKDSTGDLTRIQQLVATGGKIFNGGDSLMFSALIEGCTGCIWGGANAIPEEAARLYELVASGDLSDAAALWHRIRPTQVFHWTHDYNSSVKAATNLLGGNVGDCRKPALPIAGADLDDLKEALSALER